MAAGKLLLLILLIPALIYADDAGAEDNKPIEVDPREKPTDKPPLDLSGTDLTTRYCSLEGSECEGPTLLQPTFTATARQCMVKCSRNKECLSAFFSVEQMCHLKSKRCTESEVTPKEGTDLYRLKKQEKCPEGRETYAESYDFANSFCVYRNKACEGHNLYRKPQNIHPLTECLKKCARIKSCHGVDYNGEQCEPKKYQCDDTELKDREGSGNYLRLIAGQTTCPNNREVPNPCPEHSERVQNEGTIEEQCKCDEDYIMYEDQCLEQGTATFEIIAPHLCPADAERISFYGGIEEQCKCPAGRKFSEPDNGLYRCVCVTGTGPDCEEEGEATWEIVAPGQCPIDAERISFSGSIEEQCKCPEGTVLSGPDDFGLYQCLIEG